MRFLMLGRRRSAGLGSVAPRSAGPWLQLLATYDGPFERVGLVAGVGLVPIVAGAADHQVVRDSIR